jgi:hypothetical protein
MAISSKTEPRTGQKAAPPSRFTLTKSPHRVAGSEPTDYGFLAKAKTRFTPNSSSHHDLDSAAADYGYKIVAKTEHLPYYAPYKDKGDKKKPSALDKGLKERKDLKPPSSKKELMEVIEALPEGVLRPIYRAAAALVADPELGGAMGRDRLKASPPTARWSDRAGTDDEKLDPAEFIEKHYGRFLDGTTTRRDVEEVDLRLIRAFRDLPKDRQDALNLPVGRGAHEQAQIHIINQITAGTYGPISFSDLWSVAKAVYSRRQRNRGP